MAKEHKKLLAGMRRGPSGLNYGSAKCSDGWDRGDFVNKVDQICDGAGCVPIYARHPRDYDGVLFTCNYYLNNGSECHAEAGGNGYGIFCITPQLKQFNYTVKTN